MIQVTAILLYLVYGIGAGFLILKIVGYRRNEFLIAYAIGVSVLVLSQVPFRLFGGELVYWYVVVHGAFGVLILLALVVSWGRRGKPISPDRKKRRFAGTFGAFLIATCFSVYHIWIGPYTEIPSDFWARLGDVKDQLVVIKSGSFPAVGALQDLVDDKAYVPFLHAVVAHKTGELPLWLVMPATLVTSLCFLLGTYWFTLRLVARVRIARSAKLAMAMLSVALTMLTFGVATFSYVRYYAYFPHILNATLMLTVCSLFLDLLERKQAKLGIVPLIGIFLLVMGLVNQQEALLTIILMIVLSLWKALKVFSPNWQGSVLLGSRIKLIGTAAGGFALLSIVVVFSYRTPGPWGQPHLIDMGELIPFLDGLLIANPSMRFWDTLGLFGIVTYAWYFFRLNYFKNSDYINVAMASPVYTLFNPLFVLWFLSISSWDPLWRLSYLMPLPITTAYLVVLSISGPNKHRNLKYRYLDYIMLVCLVASLVPFNSLLISNTKARLPSLLSVSEGSGAQLWTDLIHYLDKVPGNRAILTDAVTNYVLTTALRHSGTSGAKESWQQKRDIFSGDFKDKLLYYGVDDKLLILNNRDGEMSTNGRLSGHWGEDILKVSELYPKDLRGFLDSHPLDFRMIWKNNRIWVYSILRDPAHY